MTRQAGKEKVERYDPAMTNLEYFGMEMRQAEKCVREQGDDCGHYWFAGHFYKRAIKSHIDREAREVHVPRWASLGTLRKIVYWQISPASLERFDQKGREAHQKGREALERKE